MTSVPRNLGKAALAACLLLIVAPALAQDRDSPGLLDNLFSRGEPSRPQQRQPQGPDAADLSVRIDRLENALRQLTGTIEQLQFRNQQLEQEIARLGGATPGPGAPGTIARPAPAPSAAPAPPVYNPPPPQGTTSGRRSDVFDPSQNPNAVGAPRALGGGSAPLASAGPDYPIGAPGGRAAGAPLDLTGGNSAVDVPGNTTLPPPPARNTSATGTQVATLPPSASPKDEYDLAYGYVLRKDYALAETTFKTFLKKNPTDKLAPDANYWLGESLYQRQRYQDAADSYLVVVRNYESSPKAPEALLRLGQSLAALGQKEMACASLNEVARKYPRASANVKRDVAQEQKRGHC